MIQVMGISVGQIVPLVNQPQKTPLGNHVRFAKGRIFIDLNFYHHMVGKDLRPQKRRENNLLVYNIIE